MKDLPPPLLMRSTTKNRESPQLFFCLFSVALKERTSESERDISGFHPHNPHFHPHIFGTPRFLIGRTRTSKHQKSPSPQWVWDDRRLFRTQGERRGWDSNPRGCYPYTISSRARSTGLCHLSTRPQARPHFKGRRTGHLLHASEAIGAGVRKA